MFAVAIGGEAALEPLFAGLPLVQVVSVSVAAGVAEEAFFRGAMQAEWGQLLTSLLFGLVHIGRADMVLLGVWAAGAEPSRLTPHTTHSHCSTFAARPR